MVRESGGIASAIALQIPCQKGIVSSHYSALTPRRSAPLGRGDNFWIGVGGQLTTLFSRAGRRLMSDLLGMCQLATSSTGCANPTPLLRPLYPLPHHHRPPSACSRAGSSGWPARPVYALVPCCQPELPITMLDDAPPQRAVSASPRAIGRDRALACLVRAFRRGEFCSRSPDRIGVAAGPSWAGPTAPISSEAVGRAVRQRQWAAGGRQRRERRLTAAEHAARGGVRRRERVARIAPRLAKKPGRPAACLCDVCVTVADELRACAALSNLFMN